MISLTLRLHCFDLALNSLMSQKPAATTLLPTFARFPLVLVRSLRRSADFKFNENVERRLVDFGRETNSSSVMPEIRQDQIGQACFLLT